MRYRSGYCKLTYLWEYSAATVTGGYMHILAAEFPQSILKGIPPCSDHCGTVLLQTYIAGLRNLNVIVNAKVEKTSVVVLSI